MPIPTTFIFRSLNCCLSNLKAVKLPPELLCPSVINTSVFGNSRKSRLIPFLSWNIVLKEIFKPRSVGVVPPMYCIWSTALANPSNVVKFEKAISNRGVRTVEEKNSPNCVTAARASVDDIWRDWDKIITKFSRNIQLTSPHLSFQVIDEDPSMRNPTSALHSKLSNSILSEKSIFQGIVIHIPCYKL